MMKKWRGQGGTDEVKGTDGGQRGRKKVRVCERFEGPLNGLSSNLLQAGDDVLAVGVLLESSNVRLDAGDEEVALGVVANFEYFLDNIVGIRVLHHDFERHETSARGSALRNDLLEDDLAIVVGSILDALLNDVRGELVLRE